MVMVVVVHRLRADLGITRDGSKFVEGDIQDFVECLRRTHSSGESVLCEDQVKMSGCLLGVYLHYTHNLVIVALCTCIRLRSIGQSRKTSSLLVDRRPV